MQRVDGHHPNVGIAVSRPRPAPRIHSVFLFYAQLEPCRQQFCDCGSPIAEVFDILGLENEFNVVVPPMQYSASGMRLGIISVEGHGSSILVDLPSLGAKELRQDAALLAAPSYCVFRV